jgi:hypothetical protein
MIREASRALQVWLTCKVQFTKLAYGNSRVLAKSDG